LRLIGPFRSDGRTWTIATDDSKAQHELFHFRPLLG